MASSTPPPSNSSPSSSPPVPPSRTSSRPAPITTSHPACPFSDAPSLPTLSTPTQQGWDAIRRRVLPPPSSTRHQWPVLHPTAPGELHYPIRPGTESGRNTPVREGGFARLVGAGRRKKEMPEQSTQQRFGDELARVELLLRGGGAAGRVIVAGSSGRRRAGSAAGGGEAVGGADVVQGLRLLSATLDRYRTAGRLPDQAGVLSLLATFFRGPLSRESEGIARFALEVFTKMCGDYAPDEAEEELERWRWLLKAMEWESPELRTRISSTLESTLSTAAHAQLWTHPASPLAFQSLLAALVRLVYTLSSSRSADPNVLATIRSLLHRLATGTILTPDPPAFASALSLPLSSLTPLPRPQLAQVITLHSLLLLSLSSDPSLRDYLFSSSLISQYWLTTPATAPPLLALLARSALLLLAPSPLTPSSDIFAPAPSRSARPAALHDLLATHFPRTELPSLDPLVRNHLTFVYLACFAPLSLVEAQQGGTAGEARGCVCEAWKADKKGTVEVLRRAVREVSPGALGGIVGTLLVGMEEVSVGMANPLLPTFFERLTTIGEPTPLLPLLHLLASRHPQTFFKPLFSLASTSSPASLSTVLHLSSLLGPTGFLLRDAEMMVVALLSNLGGTGAGGWEKARMGQLAGLVEMIVCVREMREMGRGREREEAERFADAFEGRFAVFLQAREQASLLPISQRILICTLLFELRMLSKPSHRPIWMTRIIVWATSSSAGDTATLEPKKGAVPLEQGEIAVTPQTLAEASRTLDAVKLLYESVGTEAAKRTSVIANVVKSTSSGAETKKLAADRLKSRIAFLSILNPAPLPSLFALLIAVHSSLGEPELKTICPLAWANLDDRQPAVFLPASFLVMLCAEKIPSVLDDVIYLDIKSSSAPVRLSVATRLASLFSARFDILSQPSANRSRRKPFKVGRQQISFVPLEVGTAAYISPELPEEARLQLGSSLPPEVRRALKELGWDDRTDEQALTERQRRPLSLLPWSEIAHDASLEATLSPGKPAPLLRRNSSAGSAKFGGKRKALVTSAIAAVYLRLSELLQDPDAGVAVTSREVLVAFLRDDPEALLQPLFVDLSGTLDQQVVAIRHIRRLLAIQAILPCGAAHRLFNHLGGILKGLSRDPKSLNSLQLFALTLPSAAALAPLVSDFSLRDLRKNKVEPLFLSTGAFWYEGAMVRAPMFPQSRPLDDPFPFRRLAIDSTTFRVALVRVAQNSIAEGYLRKAPRDAFTLKKLLGQLSLPSMMDLPATLDAKVFLPRGSIAVAKMPRAQQDERSISALVARSWLLALLQVLQGLDRNFSARDELAILFDDGVNRILLVHGDDTNLVGLVLRLCMLASTRFRRIFSSSNGFGLFIPSLFKVFVDAGDNEPIRSSVQYAWQRFFRSHAESFVFQAFGALTPIFLARTDDSTRLVMADDLFKLIEALQMQSIDVADIAGIRGANEREEREALIYQANDKPDVFLASFSPNDAQSSSRLGAALGDTKPFSTDNAIKLFLTVVAYGPTSTRAGEFLTLFRLLLPNFFKTSDKAKALLQEGIDALAVVFGKAGGTKGRVPGRTEPTKAQGREEQGRASLDGKQDAEEIGSTAGDDAATWLSMRRSFLLLVEAFHACGGELGTSSLRKILGIVRFTLQDSSPSSTKASAALIDKYTLSVLGPGTAPSSAQVLGFLNEIAPFVRLYINLVDFTVLFDSLARLQQDFSLKDDSAISAVVSSKIIAHAIDACSAFAGTTHLPSHRATVRLVSAWLASANSDVFAELDRQTASAAFLSTFVFPLAVAFGEQPSTGIQTSAERDRSQAVWLRIVGYAIKASTARERSSTTGRSPSATTAMALQVIKAAIILGEEDLARSKGAWLKLASFLRELLERGGGGFLLTGDGPLPSASPRASHSAMDWTPASHSLERSSRLQVTTVDYLLWSTFELLSLYPGPLLLYLRLFMREKLSACRFASSSRLQRQDSLSTPEKRRGSNVFAKPLLSRTPSRSKGSGENLAVGGGSPTPGARFSRRRSREASPTRDAHPFRPTLAVYARDYVPIVASSSPTTSHYPQIQHLGLVSSPDYVEPSSPTNDFSSCIGSSALVRRTVERLRTVQVVFGEAVINHPMLREGVFDEEDEESTRAWTKAEALRALVEETKALVGEFGDVPAKAGGEINGEE